MTRTATQLIEQPHLDEVWLRRVFTDARTHNEWQPIPIPDETRPV